MQLKIFYIDDEEGICEIFVDYFSSDRVKVFYFMNPLEAIEDAKKNPPHLFFIDYRLPGITGDEVAKKLDPKIPKYLITGDISVKVENIFLKIFPKPFDDKEISEVIQSYVESLK
jgi:DNA-binding NtrC family response regulator